MPQSVGFMAMFREMIRIKQQLPREECIEILSKSYSVPEKKYTDVSVDISGTVSEKTENATTPVVTENKDGEKHYVYEPKDATTFTAKTYAYIEGGTAGNVYGGGWQGSVGKHTGAEVSGKFLPIAGDITNDVLGESNVVIGIRRDLREDQKSTGLPATLTYTKGIPAILRNAYSGGEGGAVYGTANLTINNGYIGYYYDNGAYKEKLDDETWSDGVGKDRLEDCGSAFGGGYDDLSSVDFTNVKMYGGVIRKSLHGGGEIATIGRGTTKQSSGAERDLDQIFKNGKTHIEMYNGHVLRNVFAGGKGYNKLKYGVGNELYTDGYVFGQTEVYIHGGEVGTIDGAKSAKGYGNVFGGGDIGYVYSSGYGYTNSRKTGTGSPGHYYYYNKNYQRS